MALRHGVPIVPSYAFGESQLLPTMNRGALLSLREWIASTFRVGLPAVYFMMAAGGDRLRQPGDFNFDPLGINVGSQEQRDAMAMKELKHGRLAMLAFGGIVTQAGLGHPYFPYV